MFKIFALVDLTFNTCGCRGRGYLVIVMLRFAAIHVVAIAGSVLSLGFSLELSTNASSELSCLGGAAVLAAVILCSANATRSTSNSAN